MRTYLNINGKVLMNTSFGGVHDCRAFAGAKVKSVVLPKECSRHETSSYPHSADRIDGARASPVGKRFEKTCFGTCCAKAKGYVRLSASPFRFLPPQNTVEVVVRLRVGRHGGKRLYDLVDFHVLALAVVFPKLPAESPLQMKTC